MNNFAPKIIFFCCNWNAYARADLVDDSNLPDKLNSRTIRTMCSGRIEPTFILQAFDQGADGVMIAGCPAGDCHYNSGNYKARRRVAMLHNMLSQFGIESKRLRLEWIPASETSKFNSTMDGFIDEVTKLGPLTLNRKVRAN
ncbi:hydrogenase iron-sulfur subunit [Chloroflexota bacterium]